MPLIRLCRTILFLGLFSVVSKHAFAAPAGKDSELFRSISWMQDLRSSIANKALNTLVLPGSHDAGAYGITAQSAICPGDIARHGLFGTLVNITPASILAAMARTQSNNFTAQLAAGARYFDLRPCLYEGEFYFSHGMIGTKLDEFFTAFKTFSQNHPDEILILDFKHFYDFQKETHLKLRYLLRTIFHNRLADSITFSPFSTYDDFIKAGKNIILIYQEESPLAFEPLFWGANKIRSEWPNTSVYSKAQLFIENDVSNRSPPRLNVSQAVVTVTTGHMRQQTLGMLYNFNPLNISTEQYAQRLSLETLSKGWQTHLKTLLQGRWKKLPFNIMILDFIGHDPALIEQLIALNMQS